MLSFYYEHIASISEPTQLLCLLAGCFSLQWIATIATTSSINHADRDSNIKKIQLLRSTNKQQAYTRCVHARTCLRMRVWVKSYYLLVALLLFLLYYLLKNLYMFYLLGRGIWFCICKNFYFFKILFSFFFFFLGFFFPSSQNFLTWALHCSVLLVMIWSIDEKNILILWKLSSIWMKILNDTACTLIWLELKFIQFNSIQFKYIDWNLNEIESNSSSTKFNSNNWITIQLKKKWNAYWWKFY